jgi:hypothetical protein
MDANHLADEAEVLMFIANKGGKVSVQIIPKDGEPDQGSPAIILAAFLNANMAELTKAAFAVYRDRHDPEAGHSLRLIAPGGGWVN